ncbi:MAG: hypothetical protein KGI25_06490 [Thaumarchaeota archaeon]|nr:hypothetical protein [Nitrososphaerota archaeon]
MADTSNFLESSPYDFGIRDWVKIIDSILKICKDGTLRTHIMYKCNLNTIQTRKYLDLLESQGLLEINGIENRRGSIYKTTSKGMEYIRAFRQLEETLR